MDKKYYIYKNEERKGPLSLEDLQQMYVSPYDLIWYPEITDWKKAWEIEQLRVLFEPQKETTSVPPTDSKPIETSSYSKEYNYNQNSGSQYNYQSNPSYGTERNGSIEYFQDKTLKLYTRNEVIYYRYANFGERLGARVIDVLILFIPALLIPLLPSWLYFALLHSSENQQTVGQKALNIKLLSIDGMKVHFGQSTGRFFANLLNVLTLFIGYLMMLLNPKSQCLHDMLASTIVVSEIRREPLH